MASLDKVFGLASLNRKLAAMPVVAGKRLRAGLEKSAEELVAAQKALAERNRNTGRTVDSIKWRVGEHQLQIRVFSDFFAARWEEFGTVKTPAIPFFFPAYRILRKKIKSRARSSVTAAVKEVSRGGT